MFTAEMSKAVSGVSGVPSSVSVRVYRRQSALTRSSVAKRNTTGSSNPLRNSLRNLIDLKSEIVPKTWSYSLTGILN